MRRVSDRSASYALPSQAGLLQKRGDLRSTKVCFDAVLPSPVEQRTANPLTSFGLQLQRTRDHLKLRVARITEKHLGLCTPVAKWNAQTHCDYNRLAEGDEIRAVNGCLPDYDAILSELAGCGQVGSMTTLTIEAARPEVLVPRHLRAIAPIRVAEPPCTQVSGSATPEPSVIFSQSGRDEDSSSDVQVSSQPERDEARSKAPRLVDHSANELLSEGSTSSSTRVPSPMAMRSSLNSLSLSASSSLKFKAVSPNTSISSANLLSNAIIRLQKSAHG